MKSSDYLFSSKSFFNKGYSVPVNVNKGAVIVETRIIRDFGIIVKNHLYFLPKGYGLTVFHSNENEQYVKDQLGDVIGVNWQNIGQALLSSAAYNYLLTSPYFWNFLYEKSLIFQVDSLLLRRGVELFEAYDFIGAPIFHTPYPAMNGGLSLRSKSVMTKIIADVHYNDAVHGNEDMYFCNLLKKHGATLIPSKEIANRFSVETLYYPLPIGLHSIDKWLPRLQLETIYNNSLNELHGNKVQ